MGTGKWETAASGEALIPAAAAARLEMQMQPGAYIYEMPIEPARSETE